MSPALRALPFVLCLMLAVPTLRAQAAELPAIFAPQTVTPEVALPAPSRPRVGSSMSDRMRLQMSERILADVRALEIPASPTSTASAAPVVTADGALLMKRFVVRSLAPRPDEVEPPAAPLLRFAPIGRLERQVKAGYSAALLRFFDGRGSLNLNVVNGAGKGMDHNNDFTRAEIELSIKW